MLFCAAHGCDHSHLYRVLTGDRQSTRLVTAFAEWLAKNGYEWPTSAKVTPAQKEAAQ